MASEQKPPEGAALIRLCREEPEWAANRIEAMRAERDEWRASYQWMVEHATFAENTAERRRKLLRDALDAIDEEAWPALFDCILAELNCPEPALRADDLRAAQAASRRGELLREAERYIRLYISGARNFGSDTMVLCNRIRAELDGSPEPRREEER